VNKKQALAGVVVHHAYLHDSFINDYHKERLGRFASLFISEQQGVLSSYTANLDIVLARVKQDVRQPFMMASRDPNDDKVEMRRVIPRTIPTWFPPASVLKAMPPTPASVPASISIPEPPVISLPPAEPPPTSPAAALVIQPLVMPATDSLPVPQPVTSGVGIGLMWALDVDVDLYVRPKPGAKELSYHRHSTPEGKYFHDYKTRNDGLDFEYVELNSGVDIRDIKVFVNYFRGHSQWPQGKVVIRYGGRSYLGEFRIQANEGNRGHDSEHRTISPFWTEIDVAGIIKAGKQSAK
jgi:hypothetical protein